MVIINFKTKIQVKKKLNLKIINHKINYKI